MSNKNLWLKTACATGIIYILSVIFPSDVYLIHMTDAQLFIGSAIVYFIAVPLYRRSFGELHLVNPIMWFIAYLLFVVTIAAPQAVIPVLIRVSYIGDYVPNFVIFVLSGWVSVKFWDAHFNAHRSTW